MLLLSISLIYVIPLERLFLKSELGKGFVVGGLFCLPVFFAGLIFITGFRTTPQKDAAFGANILGRFWGDSWRRSRSSPGCVSCSCSPPVSTSFRRQPCPTYVARPEFLTPLPPSVKVE